MQATADFGVSEVTESLATGIFLIGFGVGALFAGPISETIGRNPVYIATRELSFPTKFLPFIIFWRPEILPTSEMCPLTLESS